MTAFETNLSITNKSLRVMINLRFKTKSRTERCENINYYVKSKIGLTTSRLLQQPYCIENSLNFLYALLYFIQQKG